jgi:hypothetical protein
MSVERMKPRIRLATAQSERKRRNRIYAALRRAREAYPKSRALRKKLARALLANPYMQPKVRIWRFDRPNEVVMFPRSVSR